MSNPEDNNKVVDRRLFDKDGNVREDTVDALKEEIVEEELSLESLSRRFDVLEANISNAIQEVDATFNQVGQELKVLTDQVRSTVSDMHVRIATLEELHVNPDLADDRQAILEGRFNYDRIKEIATEYVLPEMKKQADAANKIMQARFARMQAAIQEGLSPEEAIARVEKEDADTIQKEETGIQIVSD